MTAQSAGSLRSYCEEVGELRLIIRSALACYWGLLCWYVPPGQWSHLLITVPKHKLTLTFYLDN